MAKGTFYGTRQNGRKKGTKNHRTIELEIAQKELQQSILKNITPLTVAALNSAIGERYVYRVKYERDKKTGLPLRERKHEIVSDSREIGEALDAIRNDAGLLDYEDEGTDSFYYISTKPSDTRSLQALFDRAFGKAKESVELSGTVKFSLADLAEEALKNRGKHD